MSNHKSYVATLAAENKIISKIYDYGLLVKFRLNLEVVMSALIGYAIVSGGTGTLWIYLKLFLGGFLITGASNALNQVLEKDYDKLMSRTANRPLASGRMNQTEAVIFAGLAGFSGICILATFNLLTALIGMLALILYAFVYTPLKRHSTIAVPVGAIPGALPVLLGVIAFEGQLTYLAVALFVIQFLWQFPHFWAIGFVSYEDYSKAGYKLVPERNGEIDRNLGITSMFYSVLIIPVAIFMYFRLDMSIYSTVVAVILSLIYTYFGYRLHVEFNRKAALGLMFFSFAFLPLILLGYWLL